MATTYQLAIKEVFDRLTPKEKRYAHHMARTAWLGSRIVTRQTSPESEGIYDLIFHLHKACQGDWSRFLHRTHQHDAVEPSDVDAFLEYAAQFLAHLGNYYVSSSFDFHPPTAGGGDRKAVPAVSKETLRKMASISPEATATLEQVLDQMVATPPYTLGFPSKTAQSSYYIGDEPISSEDVSVVTKVMERHNIWPENTRLRKIMDGNKPVFEILQATSEISGPAMLDSDFPETIFQIRRGDHSAELSKVCEQLQHAVEYASNNTQAALIHQYIKYFRHGDVQTFRTAQKTWVTDTSPRVEHIIGFMETYRDPAEHDNATRFIALLPWAIPGENHGKGPFEPSLFDAPNFTIVHALAFCNSTVWDGCNLPNYSDIRETCGAKNIVFSNRLAIKAKATPASRFVDSSEVEALKKWSGPVHFVKNAIHELLGHGSGKMLSEISPGVFNFDQNKLPTNPLTGKSIDNWYKPGQTWKGVFGDLANTVEECRATLVSYYLPDDKDIQKLFGYEDEQSAAEFLYYLYLTIGVLGLEALGSYSAETGTWGDQHHRVSDFAIFKHLLRDGHGVMTLDHSPSDNTLRVKINRSKIISYGKPSLGRLALRLHVWRCTADIAACREFYEPLTAVEGKYEEWRKIVVTQNGETDLSQVKTDPGGKIVQANTFLVDDGQVRLKVYETSNVGIIQSWAERQV
ncbi:dipeptidyl peptidase III [Triangularia verruculosa]|uniref:Dipeptidyl peptidase III n=1 Tax=Triangularia verruculosa TaxID=2587418 RepID=A0AAN6XAV2_9PEZI|nr:dipeptidyl peptidase III [Triangularia verruculosa]